MDDLRRIARQAMQEHGLEPDFPPAALTQLATIQHAADTGGQHAADGGTQRTADAGDQRGARGPAVRDLRGLLWASIDNDDSQDLDQLSVAEPLADAAVKILVAIADVDVLIAMGSPIDDHARTNTTSVYTAAQIFPMLPEKLSTNLTSLADGQDRAALVIEMTVDAGGHVTTSDIYRALVHNR